MNNGFNKNLTTDKIKEAAKARLEGTSYTAIAGDIFGVSRRTEYNWRQIGSFKNKPEQYTYYNHYSAVMGAIDCLKDLPTGDAATVAA